MNNRVRVHKHDDRWVVVDHGITGDCPILSDWGSAAEAAAEVNRLLRVGLQQVLKARGAVPAEAVRRLLQPRHSDDELADVPLSERGFGV